MSSGDDKLAAFERLVLKGPGGSFELEYRLHQLSSYASTLGRGAKETLRRLARRASADPTIVKGSYHDFYRGGIPTLVEYLTPTRTSSYLSFRSRHYLAGTYAIKRVQLAHIAEAVKTTGARSVLEVGSGSGINLVGLALLLPHVGLRGIELTPGGVELARSLAADPPPELLAFIGADEIDSERRAALDGIRFEVGDATAMELPDDSVDLVFTNQALEQMGWHYREALAEIRRVARKHALFVEPFRECNRGMRRFYVVYKDYFRESWRDLGRYGFEPIAFSADVPAKFYYQAGVLLCEVPPAEAFQGRDFDTSQGQS